MAWYIPAQGVFSSEPLWTERARVTSFFEMDLEISSASLPARMSKIITRMTVVAKRYLHFVNVSIDPCDERNDDCNPATRRHEGVRASDRASPYGL